jgi:hypothetical protein
VGRVCLDACSNSIAVWVGALAALHVRALSAPSAITGQLVGCNTPGARTQMPRLQGARRGPVLRVQGMPTRVPPDVWARRWRWPGRACMREAGGEVTIVLFQTTLTVPYLNLSSLLASIQPNS